MDIDEGMLYYYKDLFTHKDINTIYKWCSLNLFK